MGQDADPVAKPTVGLSQPLLGLLAATIAITLSLIISASFAPDTFGSWVALIVMAAIPTQVVNGLVWKPLWPQALPQPFKGLAVLAVLAAASAVVTPLIILVPGGWEAPPLPFASMYTVASVCFTFWIVVVFQCWPLTLVSASPAVQGFGAIVGSYLSTYLYYRTAFSFEGMLHAPWYRPSLDPQGRFPAFDGVSFIVTTAALIHLLVIFDFWPVVAITTRWLPDKPWARQQPLTGAITGGLVLGVSYLLWHLCVAVGGMDSAVYMTTVPVSGLFGIFILLVMMQTAPFQRVAQPLKGLLMLPLIVGLAAAMFALYMAIARATVGDLHRGAPSYDMELWVANAMLGITFPLFVVLGDNFAFWPLVRPAPAPAANRMVSADDLGVSMS
jgi:hypothetical protein